MGLLHSTGDYLYNPPKDDKKKESEFQRKNLKLPLKMITQEDFINNVFRDFKGNICVFMRSKKKDGTISSHNHFYRKNELPKMYKYLKYTFGIDTYISYSTYLKKNKSKEVVGGVKERLRTQSNIVQTYMLVQDLDYYKYGISDFEFLQQIGTMIKDGEILCPSYIVMTGQGYQLIWMVEPFTNIKNYTKDKDWRQIQDFLYQKLLKFNSDYVVKNPAAVTRFVGTRHKKTKNKVLGFLLNETVYNLNDQLMYYGIIPVPDRIVNFRKKPIAITAVQVQVKEKDKGISKLHKLKNWNNFTLNRYREEDIFTFVKIKNERGESYIGMRNWLALVLRFHSLVSTDGDTEYATNRVLNLIAKMDMTDTFEDEILGRSEVAERYYDEWVTDTWDKKKYQRGGLFYTNKRMLEIMKITDDYEMQWKLQTIKIVNKKYESERKKMERLIKGEIKGSKEEYSKQRRTR